MPRGVQKKSVTWSYGRGYKNGKNNENANNIFL